MGEFTGSSPEQIFKQARDYFEDGNYDESLKMLSALVDLHPQNAEYLAWQARAYRAKEDPRAFEIADAAIKLDENQTLAYTIRSAIHADRQEYTEAIQDLTKAIDIDPNNDWVLRIRAKSFTKIGDYRKAIMDRARSYAIYRPQIYSEGNPFYIAEQHFLESLTPILENQGEHLVEFWQAALYWGLDEQKSFTSGTSYTHLYGTGGVGYIFLTDKHARIVSLAQLTQRVPPLPKKMGLLAQSLLLVRDIDHRQVEKRDRVWTIPNSSIVEARLTNPTGFSDDDVKFIKMVTNIETWEIYSDQQEKEILLTALNMAAAGELAKIWGDEKQEGRSEEEILALIEKLAELRQKGAISDKNFETKKSELLSRL